MKDAHKYINYFTTDPELMTSQLLPILGPNTKMVFVVVELMPYYGS
jgi:hypothetical protein